MTAELKEILDVIPTQWHELVLSLYNADDSFLSCDLIIQDKISSYFGLKAFWETLLSAFIQKEPIIKDDTISFVPFFTKLRPDVRRSFLTLLIRYHQDVPLDKLKCFIDNIYPHTTDWSRNSARILLKYIRLKSQGCQDEFMPVDEEYRFDDVVKSRVRSVCNKIESLSKVYKQDSVIPRVSDESNISVHDEHPTESSILNINKDSSLQELTKVTECIQSPDDGQDIICISDEEMMSPPSKLSSPSSARKRVSSVSLSQASSKIPKQGDEQKNEVVDYDCQVKLERLRELWEDDSADISDDLNLLVSATPLELQNICGMLNRTELSEIQISTACKHLTSLSENLSFANCKLFIQLILLPKVMNLVQNISRTLIQAVLKLAEVYPRQLCDGLIVPCCFSIKSPSQMELICKLIKDSYNDANREYITEKLANESLEMNESMVTILHTLIDCKVEISATSMSQILNLLYKNGTNMSDNLKFGKLLLAIIKKYGSQFSQENVDTLSHILANHGTFMKKSAESSLRRLKTKK